MFNAMGTGGYLSYPKDAVAKLMYNAIMDFDARQPRTWLKDVTFCVYGQDKDTVRVGYKNCLQLLGDKSNDLGCK